MKRILKRLALSIVRFFSGKKIIVSLTSYPARYENLHLVIKSLLKQELRPNKIVLYIYEGEADALPDSLLRLQSRRFSIVRVKENIRPHKKYYYAFREFPKDLIITVDDDWVYPKDLVMTLYRGYLQHKDAIICGRSRIIRFNPDGKMLPYSEWPICYDDSVCGKNIIATGVGGVLYQPRLLDERVMDMDRLKMIALNQDDLWLKTMEVLKGTKTAPVSVNWRDGRSLDSESSLFSRNALGANDECLKAILEYYNIPENLFNE